MTNPNEPMLPYFSPLLPWQATVWQKLTASALQADSRLPHALLASGMAGIGKRAFIWRWVAWQLCHNREKSLNGACGNCESCNLLKVGNQPDLKVLPNTSSPTFDIETEVAEQQKQAKKPKKTKKSQASKVVNPKIKVDDIRNIQNFVHQGSRGTRICVFDHAETMTLAAANALLKTLEEPSQGVQLILITDKPSLLLPTIKSRVQQLPLHKIDRTQSQQYVQSQLSQTDSTQVTQLLNISNHAPLQAINIANSDWYTLRKLWLTTWLALRADTRTPVTASNYWQSHLELRNFLTLTQVMLADLQRLSSNMPTYQQDIDFSVISKENIPSVESLFNLTQVLRTIDNSQKQNVQDQLAYDMLMTHIATM